MAVDAFLLVLIGTIYVIYRNRKRNPDSGRSLTCIEILWIFGKYYTLAFFLIFNANVAFSSMLTLYNASTSSPIAIANIVLSAVVLAFGFVFFVMLYLWTKELSTAAIYPEHVQQYSTSNNDHNNDRLERFDRSFADVSIKSHHSGAVPQLNESRN